MIEVNTFAMPIIGISGARISKTIMLIPALKAAKFAPISMGGFYPERFPALVANQFNLAGTLQWMPAQIFSSCFWCRPAFMAFYYAFRNLGHCAGIEIISSAKIIEIMNGHPFPCWGKQEPIYRHIGFGLLGTFFTLMNNAEFRPRSKADDFAFIPLGDLQASGWRMMHSELGFNIQSKVVELIACLFEMLAPLLLHVQGFFWRNPFKDHKFEIALSVFRPGVLKFFISMGITTEMVTMRAEANAETLRRAADVTDICDLVSKHINAGIHESALVNDCIMEV